MTAIEVLTLVALIGSAAVSWSLPAISRNVMHAPVLPTDRERFIATIVAGALTATVVRSTPEHALAVLPLVMAAVPLVWIDALEHRLPHVLVLPLYPVTLLVTTDTVAATLLAVGVVSVMGVLVLFAGMGAGDVTLSGLLALSLAHLGVSGLMATAALAFMLAGAYAIAGLVSGRLRRHEAIAFGPALLVAAGVAAVVSG